MSTYLHLTEEFNRGRLRSIICSGQAVVLHRLAIMSKDGDWILREEEECFHHVLGVLAKGGATYRFGAPLDARWMAGGWSAHFQFHHGPLRVRTDFFTRPPRISPARLAEIWREQEGRPLPFTGARDLAELKKTNRERDYAVIGELARLMTDVRDQFLYSRSARDLMRLREDHPRLAEELASGRPLLGAIVEGRDRLEQALDAERRQLMRANESRLAAYQDAAEPWAQRWPTLNRQISSLPLPEAHALLVAEAAGVLPLSVAGAGQGRNA